MENYSAVSQLELGYHLALVRERAGINQAELARQVTWSPAVLSRVEAGERPLSMDELETILSAINTPEATQLSEVLKRNWRVLPRPPLDHPDHDLLWSAEQVAQELTAFRERDDVRHAFERRLTEYLSEIQRSANLLLKREYHIAFIGSIGIGKSTAICRVAHLEVSGQDGGPPVPVLEAGAGGVTICEVHLRTGPDYGLMIEPCSDEEVRTDVTDFAEHILRTKTFGHEDSQEADPDSQGISKEIERAIRNMSNLRIRREKGAGGKPLRRDEAKELAQPENSVRELVVEVLARMELHRRDRRDIWYDPSSGKEPLLWLKETFEQINNGRHPEFTLPKRIEVIAPDNLLTGNDLTVRFIDTKGIDRTAARADLECHLGEPHTLAVLCSGFNDAPATAATLLLERAKEIGVRGLDLNSALLILPRPNEALAVKDESGIRVENTEEGYDLKSEQVAMALEPLGLQHLPIGFFNALSDDPTRLYTFIVEQLNRVRQSFRARMKEVTDNAMTLLKNHEKEQVQEVVRAAASMLKSWVSQNSEVHGPCAHVQDSLMAQISRAYASTIRAAVRREGEWPNLNYSHHLGYGARRIAASSLEKTVAGLSELCRTMLGNPEYAEANDLIQQTEQVLNISYEDLLRKVQLMGQTAFRDELKVDQNFWMGCDSEWGGGPGYRDRVAHRNSEWFSKEKRVELESQLKSLIQREWRQAMERVSALLETE